MKWMTWIARGGGFWLTATALSFASGLWVEIAQQKNHSIAKAVLACAIFGALGVWSALNHERQSWKWGPIALLIGGWLLDFRHGLALSHQYANYTAFAMGAFLGMLKLVSESRFLIPLPQVKFEFKFDKGPSRKRAARDLSRQIRDLVLALHHNFNINPRQREFVEQNLLSAIEGLVRMGHYEKAARLCGMVPTTVVRFEMALVGLEIDQGLKIAGEAYRQDDWGTALKLLNWALSANPSPERLKKIYSTAAIIAQQVSQLDDTFEAKVTALQLDPKLRSAVKWAAQYFAMKRTGTL